MSAEYDMKVGNKIVGRGITNDEERLEREHEGQCPGAHIVLFGAAHHLRGRV